jgi:lambda repressor-like predicted transcriptional regulator
VRRHKYVHIRLCVAEIIEERHITMAKLSRMSDLALNTIIAACKKPERAVSIQTLVKIARALNVDVSALYEVIDDE